MKVRVGYPNFDGLAETSEDGTRSGYAYNFLQLMAPYANFEYEYVGYDKTWDELFDMLSKGEVDMLLPVYKSLERSSNLDFSSNDIGNSSIMLTSLSTNPTYIPGNPRTFNGIIIGILESGSCAPLLKKYASNFKFNYHLKTYPTPEALYEALSSSEVEAIATSDLRSLKQNEIVLARFSNEPIFVSIKRGDPILLERVNQAIAKLDIAQPEWRYEIYTQSHGIVSYQEDVMLNIEERAYLKRLSSEEPIKVIFNPDRAPYAFIENGKVKGIFYDLFVQFAEQYGLNYELIPVKETKEYNAIIDRQEAEMVFDCPMPYNLSESRGYYVTQSYCQGDFAELHRKNWTEPKTVAVKRGAVGMTPVYRAMYKDKTLLEYDSLDGCVKAVKNGDADCAYMYIYTAANYVSADVTATLDYTPVHGAFTHFRVAVKRGLDSELFSIMNKYANTVSDNTIQTLFAKYRETPSSSIRYFIYHHPLSFLGIILLLVAMTIVLSLSHISRRRERSANKLIEEAYLIADKANNAKSEFLASISHDMRTPMNTIMGMNNIAINNIEDTKKVEECLSKIEVSARHLMEMINNVLDISVIEAGEMKFSEESVDIAELVEDCCLILSSQAQKRDVKIIRNENNVLKTPHVISSPLQLRQIILNIASNGIKFNNQGGTLEIRCEENHVSDDIVEYLFIFIDTGIGMSQDYLDHLFEPFSREDGDLNLSFRGAGLGLSIVKRLVDAMNGTIKVESEKGVGSTFTVSLPLKVDKTKQVEDTRCQVKDTSDIKGVRVLIVDDNELNLEIERYALEGIGAVVTTTQNAAEALCILAENGIAYDIVLMDLVMPEMDGFQAAKAIRDSGSMIPIIAITANAFDEDRTKALAMGMNGFISKPIDRDSLIREIRKFYKA